MLRWHYRSLHHSLIAVSNREFYENKLFVIPSPEIESDEFGLRFHHVPNGVFDRGGSRQNRTEARAVAEAVMSHACNDREHSLGVAAFSVAQRDSILSELELLRRDHQELESFFSTGVPEPFFVKNLENIQGDERDVIFISVGYGRDSSGYMAMGFGPLQHDGGERRLNVLISRAKRRCEVFSSITADDIDLTRARSRGVAALKTFVSYARKGILDIAKPTGGDYSSEFEEEVALLSPDWDIRSNAKSESLDFSSTWRFVTLTRRAGICWGSNATGNLSFVPICTRSRSTSRASINRSRLAITSNLEH